MTKKIVGEVSRTWQEGDRPSDTISSRFEEIIAYNAGHGYRLHSWRLNSVYLQERGLVTETIVAVFESVREMEVES